MDQNGSERIKIDRNSLEMHQTWCSLEMSWIGQVLESSRHTNRQNWAWTQQLIIGSHLWAHLMSWKCVFLLLLLCYISKVFSPWNMQIKHKKPFKAPFVQNHEVLLKKPFSVNLYLDKFPIFCCIYGSKFWCIIS